MLPFKATGVKSSHLLADQWQNWKQGFHTTSTFWHHRLTDQIVKAHGDIPGQKILTLASNLTR